MAESATVEAAMIGNRKIPDQKVGRPISRVLSWTVIPLGPASPQASSDLPGSSAGHAIGTLFGLAPGGVYPATAVASGAVRSYRTFSPLPVQLSRRRAPSAVSSLRHFP